jgi:hypothetical protein
MAESWHTSDDGSRNGKSSRDRFAHPMSTGFYSSICLAAIAFHPVSITFPIADVRFMAFSTSYVEGAGFPIRQKGRLV